jgi:hypothetical protein
MREIHWIPAYAGMTKKKDVACYVSTRTLIPGQDRNDSQEDPLNTTSLHKNLSQSFLFGTHFSSGGIRNSLSLSQIIN